MTPTTRRRLVTAIGAGLPIHQACALCRISKTVFHDWRSKNESFNAAIETAVAESIEGHLRAVTTAAKNGDVSSSRWLLERLWPHYFSRTRLELTGADGGPITGAVLTLQWPHQQSPTHEKPIIEDNFALASQDPG
jgi:hypothetical protein